MRYEKRGRFGMSQVQIDPGFRDTIPSLREDEQRQLEANILAHGCREPLVVWAETSLLLDGPHRYAICQRHALPFETTSVSLPDREAALDGIDTNQLGRRNLTPDQASLLRGRIYNRAKKREGRPEKLPQFEGVFPGETAERLATQHGVSRTTIERDGAFARAVEKVKIVAPTIERKVVTGQAPPKASVVHAAAILDTAPDQAAEILQGTKTISQVKREIKRAEVQQGLAALPSAKYRVLYADPPWKYSNSGII